MSRKILVVEDVDHNRILIRTNLEIEGYTVIELEDGSKVLETVLEHTPDLIFMDIQLPGLDGMEVTRALKLDARVRHIPIVAVTAFAMRADRERIIAAGCDDYLSKPFRRDELLLMVDKYTRLKE